MVEHPLIVIGAGPGGYAAAFLAADKGLDVTLVDDRNAPGGVCLHVGCIPSKTLLHIAKLIGEARQAKEWGLDFGEPRIDLKGLRKWKNKVVEQMTGGLAQLSKQRKVKRINGRAVFQNAHSVKVGNELLKFKHCIVATGSRPAWPKGFPKPGGRLMDSTNALEIEDIPERLLVIGGGYIGLEMGTVYAALGSKVTVVEMTGDLLSGVDRDLVRPLQKKLAGEFEAIHLNTNVKSLKENVDDVQAIFQNDDGSREDAFDRVLVAVGRQPNTEGLGLDAASVELDEHGFIPVNAQRQTAEPAIYAIGDVTGGALLAHKAAHEARVAVEAIAGEKTEWNPHAIPAVVFTDPEIAWCGLTESEAKEKKIDVEIAKFPWGASGRAQSLGRTEGVTKLVLQPKTGRVLGVGLCGAGSGELISEGVLAVEMGAVAEDIARSIHPHPTLSETLMESAETFLGTATHIMRKK
ncbi:Pyruvate/2-oxoglutarate dehydrogenase complex, dihydrolipoyl dehydrogenase (E3) component [Nitrospina gracilis 3/211]|uniref:Dihydrolipoyl dehydrogenase n=1 Tax=Nitrospina gracilis (strain 3/211) TaxID=1266370 RepID=M1YVH4_NITG3|nr:MULTISPECIES: dihydrolipoyl dehydrogenase [Nitrospina]MCF8722282.1 dihydrolipoamide dehydrogenase [Nitrospina sp. Nb-3]CCQ89485.1 Pyruvate/2-oxoglutarate dehydrogenase complex, dihydrolipoyl dehydrogenase (E3) component [Nitrospina gracilis 3/211]